jgi:hypothetical protein
MGNSKHKGGRERRLRVRGVRRNPPDLKKLASALIELAQAQAETDALVAHEGGAPKTEADVPKRKSA